MYIKLLEILPFRNNCQQCQNIEETLDMLINKTNCLKIKSLHNIVFFINEMRSYLI